jgi:hypothetical protein
LRLTGNSLEALGDAIRLEEFVTVFLTREARYSINESDAPQRAAVEGRVEREPQPPRPDATGGADCVGPV